MKIYTSSIQYSPFFILLLFVSCSKMSDEGSKEITFFKEDLYSLKTKGRVVKLTEEGSRYIFTYDYLADSSSLKTKEVSKNDSDYDKTMIAELKAKEKQQKLETQKLAERQNSIIILEKKLGKQKKLLDARETELEKRLKEVEILEKKLVEKKAILDATEAKKLVDKKNAEKNAEKERLAKLGLSKEEGEYKDGKKDGLWSYYDLNGLKLREIMFENGMDLYWTFYKPNGKKEKQGKMVNGKEEGNWTFFDENGIKERETEHKSGVEEGIYSLWYENGQKKEEGPYLVDVRIGKWTWWYETGAKWREGNYLDGERDGSWIFWNKDGSLWKEQVYNNGEFVSKKEY